MTTAEFIDDRNHLANRRDDAHGQQPADKRDGGEAHRKIGQEILEPKWRACGDHHRVTVIPRGVKQDAPAIVCRTRAVAVSKELGSVHAREHIVTVGIDRIIGQDVLEGMDSSATWRVT